LFAYDTAWAALNQMIREGRPFSGNERNCAFLNLGPASNKFANVSAASGLDFNDDGRGLAIADWDFDGDLDFLVTNRTAPRVRLLRNDSPHPDSARWVAFKLQGSKANRDAIGARLEVHFPDGSKRIKSLAAGHSHLSQSTKWIHVGLGDQPRITKVVVHWPGTSTQQFTGCSPGNRYRLVEGNPAPALYSAPDTGPPLATGSATGKPESDAGRIVLLRPPPIPSLSATTLDGSPIDLDTTGQPLLVNLWATWCLPCLAEMKEWSQHQSEIAKSGLRIISINIDEPGESPAADRKKIRNFVNRIDYPFTVGLPSKKLPETLDTIQLALIGRQSPLPVPSSFLITADRQVAVIYRGPVTAGQLLQDIGLLDASPEKTLATATPFPGTWIDTPSPTGAKHIAATFTKQGDLQSAINYCNYVLTRAKTQPHLLDDGEAIDLLRVSAAAHYDLKEPAESLAAWRQMLALSPADRLALLEISRCHAVLGELPQAAAAMEEVLAINRDDPDNLAQLAGFKQRLGDTSTAVALFDESFTLRPSTSPSQLFSYSTLLVAAGRIADAATALRSALDLRKGWPPAANNLAWILATAPQNDLRDPTEALRLATIAAQASNHQLASALGTLAASHASNGQFELAIQFAEKAIGLAKKRFPDSPDRIQPFAAPLKSYRQNIPYRDPSLASGS
ncbi:MAG: ASPIC/UnbV domain-containing protein, partial [Verrucomicrobiales bacterium]|nr:ASPIC/UnbV domain-containing protein [Verrucomicrobiales bacterium]